MPKRHIHLIRPDTASGPSVPARSAEQQEVAKILEEGRRERDAGLALSGEAAKAFLANLLQRAEKRVRDSDLEPG
jgi:hypothetical protein